MNDQPGRRPQGPRTRGLPGRRARVYLQRAEVSATPRTGAHQHLTLVAPQVGAVARAELAELLGARGVDAFTDVIGAAHRR